MRYEYKFVKLDFSWFLQRTNDDYHKVVEEHGKDGWRLVQLFTPGTGLSGNVSFFELVFERELA